MLTLPASSRFATAVHLLAYLTINGEEGAIPSERLAASVNTAGSVIRRLLLQLTAAGLTKTQLGTGGGVRLARPAEAVTLLQVFDAVENVEAFALHRNPPNPACRVGRNISSVLESVAQKVETAMKAQLQNQTLADVACEVLQAEQSKRKRK